MAKIATSKKTAAAAKKPDIIFKTLPEANLKAIGMGGTFFRTAARFSSRFSFEPPCVVNGKVHPSSVFSIGAFSYFRGRMVRAARIGRYCSIAPEVVIGATEHPIDWLSTSKIMYSPNGYDFEAFYNRSAGITARRERFIYSERISEVNIGNDVWIGDSAFIRGGVTIGDGAIVGAHAVVTKDVPPYSIVAGVPARVVKMRFPDAVIERLLASRWWRYPLHEILAGPATDPLRCLDWIDDQVSRGLLLPYEPEWITARNIREKLRTVVPDSGPAIEDPDE